MKIRNGLEMIVKGKIAETKAYFYGITFGKWFIGIVKMNEYPKQNKEK
jgi:hypothetical protein